VKQTGPGFSPARIALLAFAVAVLAAWALALFPIHCPDTWWHLRTGRLILEQHRIPTTDPFTYTAAGRPWVTHEWLAEVLLYLLYRVGGANLLVVTKAVLAALALGTGAAAGLVGPRSSERLPAAALGVLLAAPLMALRAFERPHLITAVLLATTLLLLRLESGTGRRLWRWLLVPLLLLWANLHSGFVLGLCLVGLYWAGEALTPRVPDRTGARRRPAWRDRLLVGVALPVASLANPNHVRALLYPFWLMATPGVRANIAELRSIFDPVSRGALPVILGSLVATAVVAAALLLAAGRRIRWSLVLPLLFFAALALFSVRGLNEFAVLVPALLAAHGGRPGRRRRLAITVSGLVVLSALAAVLAAARWGMPMGRGVPGRRLGLGVNPVNCPEAAIRFVKSQAPAGRLYNAMTFGAYAIHELWPDKQVYIDGRLDVFPPGFLDSYVRMRESGAGWDEAVAEYGISAAVVDYQPPGTLRGLGARLAADSAWVCAFFSDNAIVYIRRGTGNDRILDRFGMSFDPSARTSASVESYVARADSAELAQTVAALRAMIEFAPGERAPAAVLQNIEHFARRRGREERQ